MNIVLADDERLPRLGLKSMIEELYPEQHSFIEVTNKEVFLPLSTLLDKAILALQLQDSVNLHKALADLRNLKHGDALLSQCDISLARVFELTFHHPVETSSIAQLADSIQQLHNSDNAPDIIEKINRYVDENYMNQIGINTISDLLGISPNYLSKTYKMKTGENFTDYLTNVRVADFMSCHGTALMSCH